MHCMRLPGNKWHARKHPYRTLPCNALRVWRKIHLRIDEQTLEVRALYCPAGDLHCKSAERGDHWEPYRRCTGPARPAQPDPGRRGDRQRHCAPSRDIASRCPAGQWTAPMIPASAMMLSLTAAPAPSSRPARKRSRGRPSPLVQSPETRHCAPQNISAVRSGETGADTTAEAASRLTLSGSCDAKPCRAVDALHETSGAAPHGAGL
jgi:hypothetical protein